MSHRGYYRVWRKIKDWPMRNNPNYFSVWHHLLEKASAVKRKTFFNGDEIELQPGQLITGRKKISVSTGVSESTVERVLENLEKWTQIEQQKTPRSRCITITNWDMYAGDELIVNNKRTTNGQQADTIKEVKRSLKKDKHIYGEKVSLTEEEHEKLVERFGEAGTADRIERLDTYIQAKGKKYKSHYHTILMWEGKNKGSDTEYVINRPTTKRAQDNTFDAIDAALNARGEEDAKP